MEATNTLQKSATNFEGIRCCAVKCSSGSDSSGKNFYFQFPKCDSEDLESVERCAAWVRKAGNIDLLKLRSSDLSKKFYLCCNHFADWSARNNTHRFIPADAVPSFFDCAPLTKRAMRAFPVILENVGIDGNTTADSIDDSVSNNGGEAFKDSSCEPVAKSTPIIVEEQFETIKTEVEEGADVGKIDSSENTEALATAMTDCALDLDYTPSTRIEPLTNGKRHIPKRKAKSNAVNKICSNQSSNQEAGQEDPARKMLKTVQKSVLTNQRERMSVTSISLKENPEPERLGARSTIVSHNILSKLGTPCEAFAVRQEKSDGAKECFQQYQPERTGTNPKHVEITSRQDRQSLNNLSKSDNWCLAEPLHRTFGTQTSSENVNQGREIIRILDSDKKLQIFSGLPSFYVLNNITDSTLKMVMNDQAMISDIEQTLREWIVLTCTKFRLGLSLDALSVMFEVPEDECRKIVEKTCLFLRKTLSLPDCHKFVWYIPSEVLNGIADYSDNI